MRAGIVPYAWDTLITGATVFDGTGRPPRTLDVAFEGRSVACVGLNLDPNLARDSLDARGLWLMPGLLDIHTHYDLEVELEPELRESIRHGTTTVVMSNCSLGLAFGHQRVAKTGQDPIVDCFARVENIPKPVLRKVAEKATWSNSADYLKHFKGIKLGPNVVPMIPHSMLRIEVMGLTDAVTRPPNPSELGRMAQLLETAMQEGYVGFSTDALPFHYLANDPHRKKKIPSQHLTFRELLQLTKIVRRHGRVWQATPAKDKPLQILRDFMLTSGRLFGRPLKVTAVAAMDLVTNRSLSRMGLVLTRMFNSRWVDGHFRLQALAAPFKVWSEGPITPLAEEIPELRELNEPDLEDREARRRILQDPKYRARFVRMWIQGRSGISFARLARWMKREPIALTRRLEDMFVSKSPIPDWLGQDLGTVFNRLRQFQATGSGALSEREEVAFKEAPSFMGYASVGADAEFLLHLFERYDTDLVWCSVTANRDPRTLKKLLTDGQILPGFSDSGAHLTNMAFYDVNLRGLRLVAADGLSTLSRHVRRLTSEPAEFFGLAGIGRLEPGYQADAVLIDPEALRKYDGEASIHEMYRPAFEHMQLVNRSDGVVAAVWIAGKKAWDGRDFTPALGHEDMGRCLTAGQEDDGRGEPQ